MPGIKGLVTAGLEAFNRGDLDSLVELYAEDAELQAPGREPAQGREAIRSYWSDVREGFPDSKVELVTVVDSADRAATEVRLLGVNSGPLRIAGSELPATGKSVAITSADILLAEEGEIVEHRIYFDSAEMARQLGLESTDVLVG